MQLMSQHCIISYHYIIYSLEVIMTLLLNQAKEEGVSVSHMIEGTLHVVEAIRHAC